VKKETKKPGDAECRRLAKQAAPLVWAAMLDRDDTDHIELYCLWLVIEGIKAGDAEHCLWFMERVFVQDVLLAAMRANVRRAKRPAGHRGGRAKPRQPTVA
jgi:hypothetical protein